MQALWEWVGWMWFGRTAGGLLAVGVGIFVLGTTGDWIAKVRDYRKAQHVEAERDNLAKTCEEILNERDALRAEVDLLRTSTPYRGPQPAPNESVAEEK